MRRSKSFFVCLALLVTTMTFWTVNLVSAITTIYGPRKFIRSTGKPVVVTENFSAPSATTYNLIVLNGEKGNNRVSSATVKINGIEILKESDLNQQVDKIERSVSLLLSNSISVELRSAPGSFITVSITSENPNHPPVAQDQTITTDEDTAKAITLVATDPDGDTLTYTIVAQPSHGTLSGTLPNITYTPTAHYYGSDSFTFKANDGQVDSNTATVSITVNHVNHPPVAQNQTVTTDEDTAKAVTLSAIDPDGDPLTYQIVVPPSHGAWSGTAPNLTYTPASRYFGLDSFTFKANDGKLDSNIATVSITVNYVNHPPVTQNQSVIIDEDTAKAITLVATDPDGDTLTYTIVTQPGHGMLTGTPPNVTYTPTAHYYGSDSFTFKANDGKLDSNVATVSITVNHVNHAPVAQSQSVTTDEDVAKTITLVATDPDGDVLTYTIVAQPGHGTLTGTLPNVTYTPTPHYYGSDSFTFKANDGKLDSNIATVSITVNHVNHPPVAQDQAVTTSADTTKAITLTATDVDGDPLTYQIMAPPSHGTLSGTPPNLTYTPVPQYSGSDSFTFKANDGKVDSNIATVSITIKINHPPAAQNQCVTTDQDMAKPITLVAADPDGDPLTYKIVDQPVHGTLTGAPPDVTYTPSSQYFGPDAFTFRANDGIVDSNLARISITVAQTVTRAIITTVAGGIEPYFGDGGPATKALLNYPEDVAVDTLGNLYIADTRNNRIRKVDSQGTITTVAGDGARGYGGDGGPATQAQLSWPDRIAVDASGNVYVADTENSRIRKVDSSGTITTVAGGGNPPDGLGDGGAATQAKLGHIYGITMDTLGNLYIADEGSDARIRKVNIDGVISTVAGGGDPSDGLGDGGPATRARLHGPGVDWSGGISMDTLGNLYIADWTRIRKVNTNGIITTFAGPSGDFAEVQAIAVDTMGNLYIAEFENNRIRKADPSGTITAVAGIGPCPSERNFGNWGGFSGDGGPATQAMLDGPSGIALDPSGNLYFADWGNRRVRKIDTSGIITTVAGGNDIEGGLAIEAGNFLQPKGVAADGCGNLYIADFFRNRISKADSNGIITTFAGSNDACGSYSGGFGGDGGLATEALLDGPSGIAVDRSGNVYFVDTDNQRIRKVSPDGIITTVAGNGSYGYSGDGGLATQAAFSWPEAIAVDTFGNLYIADTDNSRIRKVDPEGIITTVAGSGPSGFGSGGYGGDNGPATEAQLDTPTGVAVDAAGNLYIADSANNRIRKVDPSGIITTIAGIGPAPGGYPWACHSGGFDGDGGPATLAMLYAPSDVAVDGLGNLYILDGCNNRIRRVDPNGAITTVAGNGTYGYSGDGGPPTLAMLSCAEGGISLDSSGNLYIAGNTRATIGDDRIFKNNNVRKIVGLLKSGTIIGKVTETATGLPLSNVAILLEDSLDISYASQTYSYGTYGLSGLPPGVFIATFSKPGYFEQTASGTAISGQTQTLDIQLIPAPSLNVVITSPHDGVTVNSSAVTAMGTVTNNASVTVNGIPATVTNNTFSVSILLTAGVNAITAVAADSYGQTASETIHITYIVLGGIVTGTVTDSLTGLPIPSATVSVSDSRNPFQTATTDMNGNYTVAPIAPGFLYVNITKEGYTPYDFFGAIASGETVTVNAALSPIVPQITNIGIGEVTTHSATIFWSTDQPADSLVDYGTTTSYGLSAADSTLTRSHTILLNNLTPGTTYHFRITSTNSYGFSSSSDMSFATWAPVPEAYDRSVTLRMDTAKAITLLAWDPDDNPLTYMIVDQPMHGALSGTLPYVTYTPAPHYIGSDSFTFKVNNGTMDSSVATVSITIITPPTITNIIMTVAGNGSNGYGGDGGLSTQAMLSSPWGIAVDTLGDLYVADSCNHRVRKVDTSGVITTVAGGGYGSDGGPATQAMLTYPEGVAVDSSGNLYIADSENNRIRRVGLDGIIATIAGSGLWGFGNGGYGGDNGPATEALLDNPIGVVVDAAGNLFIADMYNHRIRRVDPNGIITTVAGCGIQGSYIADGTPATQAMLQYPAGVAVDTSGNLYIADSGNHRILKVDSSGIITIIAGNGSPGYGGDGGPAKEAMVSWPGGVVVDASGNVYIADSGNNLIRKVDANGIITTVAGTGESGFGGDGGPAPLAMLSDPEGIALDASGNLYVADGSNNRIRKIWGLSTPTTGSVTGKVTDSSTGIPLPNVSVTIKDSLNATYSAQTGSDGTYTISGLAPGDFTATFALSGYIPQAANGTSIVGKTQTLDIQLIPAPSLTIAITSPQDGATVHSSPVIVTGTLSHGATVTVNGVQAQVNNNIFSVSIPLSEGSNAITATATDQYGQTVSETIYVVLTLVTGGSIVGTITDSSTSLPLASATVSVTDAQNLTQTALTDNNGGFTISGIGIGAFNGSITRDGYTPRTFSGTMASGQTLTLNATMDPILPIITNIAVSGTTMNSATITWTTDQLTDSLVEYGTTTSYGSWASDSTLTTSHAINIGSLTLGTTYHFRVTSKNAYGISSSSGDLTFVTIGPPTISAIVVSNITANSSRVTWTTDQLSDSSVDYGTTISYGSSAQDPTLTTSHVIVLSSLTPATTYHFRVTSKNSYGLLSSSGDGSFATPTASPITLTITSPSNNDTISRADTLVKGTIINSMGSETGVVVNGFIANVYGNQFVANHIPIVEGSNTITANATDTGGYTQTASVTVNAVTTDDYITITAIPESGVSPLESTFRIESSLDLANATFNCTGPGSVEFFPPDANGTRATITTEGIYYCTASVNDTSGKTYEDTVAITVLSKTEMDALLKVKWDGMKAALYNKNILAGLGFLLDSSMEEYQEDFSTLVDELPNIISSMQDTEMIYLRNDIAKYRMNRVHDIDGTPVTITYYIYFVKDDNGIWKIQEF